MVLCFKRLAAFDDTFYDYNFGLGKSRLSLMESTAVQMPVSALVWNLVLVTKHSGPPIDLRISDSLT